MKCPPVKNCRLCGHPYTPYVSQGAEIGDTQLCGACTDKAMGRHVRAWEYSPKGTAWAEGRPKTVPTDTEPMIQDPTRLC